MLIELLFAHYASVKLKSGAYNDIYIIQPAFINRIGPADDKGIIKISETAAPGRQHQRINSEQVVQRATVQDWKSPQIAMVSSIDVDNAAKPLVLILADIHRLGDVPSDGAVIEVICPRKLR